MQDGKSDELYATLQHEFKDLAVGEKKDFELGNGKMCVMRKDYDSYNADLMNSEGKSVAKTEDLNLSDLATELAESLSQKKTPSDDMREEMKSVQSDMVGSIYGKAEEKIDSDDEISKPVDSIDLDDDGMASESELQYAALEETTRFLVDQLKNKHESEEMPDIDDYPSGGHEVKIRGGDGFYYFYLITPENEVVHLATTGKSKAMLGPTMEQLVSKERWGFKNDMKVFKSAGTAQNTKQNMIVSGQRNREAPVWGINSYDDSTDNSLTSRQREAIANKMAEEQYFGVYSVVNNQDTTYVIGFSGPNGSVKRYTLDRDGNMEAITGTNATEMEEYEGNKMKDNRKFGKGPFQLSPSPSQLMKSHAFGSGMKVVEIKEEDKTPKIDGEKFKMTKSMFELLEPRKREVLIAQNLRIRNKRSDVVKW